MLHRVGISSRAWLAYCRKSLGTKWRSSCPRSALDRASRKFVASQRSSINADVVAGRFSATRYAQVNWASQKQHLLFCRWLDSIIQRTYWRSSSMTCWNRITCRQFTFTYANQNLEFSCKPNHVYNTATIRPSHIFTELHGLTSKRIKVSPWPYFELPKSFPTELWDLS